jgi:predicted MFS family arabinose efflux permease
MSPYKKAIPIFVGMTFLYFISMYAYVPILSPYAQNLGATLSMIGIITGAYGLIQVFLRIPLGIASDKMRRRKVFVMAGMAMNIVAALVMLFADSPVWVLLCRMCSGAAAVAWVHISVLFTSYFPAHKSAQAISILNAISYSGNMCGTLLGGAIGNSFGVQAAFITSIIAGAVSLVISLFIKENRPPVAQEPITVKKLLLMGKEKNLLIVSILAVLIQLIAFGTTFGFVPIQADALGATSMQQSILTAMASLSAFCSSFLVGIVFTKYIGKYLTIIIGFVLAFITTAAFPYMTSIMGLYVVQFIGGFAKGMIFPTLMSLSIESVAPEKRSTAMGFFQAIYGVGMFLGPTLTGFISDLIGMTGGFWVIGSMGIFGAIITAFYARMNKNQPALNP